MPDKQLIEAEKLWCENCINFDYERMDMGGISFCKVNGACVFAEEYIEECKFRNVPTEKIVVID